MSETIFVALLGEPPGQLRPVQAARRAGDVFLILSKNDDPEDEQWQFSSGSLVRCESRPGEGGERLVAIEAVRPHAPKLIRETPG